MLTPRSLPWILLLNRLLVLTVAITFVASAMSIAYAAGQRTNEAGRPAVADNAVAAARSELRTNR